MQITKQGEPRPVWFITGASSGVGRALAEIALDRGDRVVAAARRTETVEDLSSRDPDNALAVRLDVRNEEQARQAVDAALARFGRIDRVVNSAGHGLFGPVEKATDGQARELFDTGFFGVLNVLRASLPVLRKQRSGHVFQMSSLFGQMSYPGTGLLAAVKHAVSGFTEALAQELAPLDIHFTILEPFAINTSFVPDSVFTEVGPDYDNTVGALFRTLHELPFDQLPTAEAIASAIVWVARTGRPPLHLALGRTSGREIHDALTARLRDLAEWDEVTDSIADPARCAHDPGAVVAPPLVATQIHP